MNTRYHKTAAGLAEVRARSLPLSRPVRNLLLSINASQPASFWLSQLQGISPADLKMLVDAGLIEAEGSPDVSTAGQGHPADPAPDPRTEFDPTSPAEREPPQASSSSAATKAAPSGDAQWLELQTEIFDASYALLYEVLNAQGKAQLGLVRGYRFALDVEKCNGQAEIQAFARKFVERLRDEYGMVAVRRFHTALRAKR